ncbi:hypothetical protein PUN28_003212 [Cardiocondyla obscurior]|uniref:Uncharacterized protein n=1 Tax=Cardiocondyla obscurior TaxID=286306 RepID=A0AAW2GMA9_9HYME
MCTDLSLSPHIHESRSFVSLKAAIIKFDALLRLYSTNLACVASRRAARRCNVLDEIKAMTEKSKKKFKMIYLRNLYKDTRGIKFIEESFDLNNADLSMKIKRTTRTSENTSGCGRASRRTS